VFSWLAGLGRRAYHDVTGFVGSAAHAVASGLVGLLSLLFGHVTGAWDDFTRAMGDFRKTVEDYCREAWRKAEEVIRYWIPHFAYTAWWWVTHPDQFAHVLLYHLVAWAEREAYTLARHLGEFGLHYVRHNVRRLAHLAEAVIAAVL
jgi:hypothetical protein